MDVMTASPPVQPAALPPRCWGAPGSLWDTPGAPRGVRTLRPLLLAPSLSTHVGKTAVKTATFTYHTVQAPLLDLPPAASPVCVLRPAGKARGQVGFSPQTFQDLLWTVNSGYTTQVFCYEEKPLSLHGKAKRTESCKVPHFKCHKD